MSALPELEKLAITFGGRAWRLRLPSPQLRKLAVPSIMQDNAATRYAEISYLQSVDPA
jgi:hypothetical protein